MSEINDNKTFDFATAVKYLQDGKRVTTVGCISDYFFLVNGLPVGCDGRARSFPINACLLTWRLYNAETNDNKTFDFVTAIDYLLDGKAVCIPDSETFFVLDEDGDFTEYLRPEFSYLSDCSYVGNMYLDSFRVTSLWGLLS